MKPNIEADKHFLKLVEDGILYISEYGEVWIKNKLVNLHPQSGYNRLEYKSNGIQVHRLVYMVYNACTIPENYTINHKDGNKFNNYYTNLELATYSENNKHAFATGLNIVTDNAKKLSSDRFVGTKNIHSKLSKEDVLFIRSSYKTGEIDKYWVMDNFNINRRSSENLLKGQTYNRTEYFP